MKGFWVEILKVGKWTDAHGTPFNINQDDLEKINLAHKEVYPDVEPVLRLGDHPAFEDSLKPGVGYVPETKVEGDTLLAKFIDMPEIVLGALKAKMYKNVSTGLWKDYRHKGKTHQWLINHVAILGAELPAITGLADIQAYMRDGTTSVIPENVYCLTHERKKEKEIMTELEIKLQADLDKANGENKTLEASNEKLSGDLKTSQDLVVEKDKEIMEFSDGQIKTEVEAIVDKVIEDKRLLPADRDKAITTGVALRASIHLSADGKNPAFDGWKDTLASGGEVIDLSDKGKTGAKQTPDNFDAQVKAGRDATNRVQGNEEK